MARLCFAMIASNLISPGHANGDESARHSDQTLPPITVRSVLQGNELNIQVKNVSHSSLVLKSITSESITYEVWSMLRLASGQIQLNTVKPLPVAVHSDDDTEARRASLREIIRGKNAVTLPPGQEMTSSIAMDQLIAPYQSLVQSNAEMKLIVEVFLPQLIVGASDLENKAAEPALDLSKIKFTCGKYLLSEGQWRSTGRH